MLIICLQSQIQFYVTNGKVSGELASIFERDVDWSGIVRIASLTFPGVLSG